MEEIWKNIDGYGGDYQISNLGRVRSNKSKTCKILAGSFSKQSGYYQIVLYKNSKPRLHTIHRLVAEAFISNPLNKETVNHKNGIKTDNSIDNLEWATYSENLKHAFRTGLAIPYPKGKFGKENNVAKSILQYTKNGEFIKEWNCMSTAAKELNINISSLSHCAKGKYKLAGGYVWKYLDK